MSQGEESCKMYGNCTNGVDVKDCNPSCDFYNPKDGVLSEEVARVVDEELEKETMERPEVKLEHSDLPKFDKVHEFFVIKKHVFLMQSVSPKKIILKFKRKLKDSDTLGDGCYIFKNQKEELLEPSKVFVKFDREAKANKAKADADKEKKDKQ